VRRLNLWIRALFKWLAVDFYRNAESGRRMSG
jgi:hypothetical protein